MAKDQEKKIIEAYIDYLLSQGEQPKSVYAFAKANKMKETDFYDYFSSFEHLEEQVWLKDISAAVDQVKSQEVWEQYSVREKLLSFFYTYIETLKEHRSFISLAVKQEKGLKSLTNSKIPKVVKDKFSDFSTELITEGLVSGEVKDRKQLNERYRDAMWLQFMFILNFWVKDQSKGFEKTDQAIEKGVNVTFDLISRNPFDNLIDYGKFLAQNSINL